MNQTSTTRSNIQMQTKYTIQVCVLKSNLVTICGSNLFAIAQHTLNESKHETILKTLITTTINLFRKKLIKSYNGQNTLPILKQLVQLASSFRVLRYIKLLRPLLPNSKINKIRISLINKDKSSTFSKQTYQKQELLTVEILLHHVDDLLNSE